MKKICVFLIHFYQRFISPTKGFHCAHHVLHGQQTCSNAIKDIIVEHGLLKGWSKIRTRFKACGNAYQTLVESPALLQRADIPCDVPCGECDLGGGGPRESPCTPCDLLNCDGPKLSKRTWRRIIVVGLIVLLVVMCWHYG